MVHESSKKLTRNVIRAAQHMISRISNPNIYLIAKDFFPNQKGIFIGLKLYKNIQILKFRIGDFCENMRRAAQSLVYKNNKK